MSDKNIISIQIMKDDEAVINLFESEAMLDFQKLESSSFDGQSEIITLLVTLTPMVLAFIGKVISDQIRSKKHIKIVYKGIQIQGIDESNAMEIINKIIYDQENIE